MLYGLACQSIFAFLVLDSFHQRITIKIASAFHAWVCTAIYANHTPVIRASLWDHLRHLRSAIQLPWILLGDFNEILLPFETSGDVFCSSRASVFASMLEYCYMIDID